MPLKKIEVSIEKSVLPASVEDFLREADIRVNQFLQNNPKRETGFVPSNFPLVYNALQAISYENLSNGNSICEWGSGYGVVSSLASMLGFHACGIEIQSALVDASRILADDFSLPVEFAHGSFVPSGAEAHAAEAYSDNNAEYSWLVKDEENAYSKHGLRLDSFDIIFAYPWPGEQYLIERLFEDGAAIGALLVTYSDLDSIHICRKVEEPSTAKLDVACSD